MSNNGAATDARRHCLPDSNMGRQLYAIMPSVYRHRDRCRPDDAGDLSKYLDACGELLDRVHATSLQRLADSFPDNPPENELACQEWLLPYLAQLVDARLVSPDARGRRDEVANAVGWRQRKGTVRCTEDIAESVGSVEVEVQEGWKRVAVTPQMDMPVMPASAFGIADDRKLSDGRLEPKFDRRRPIDAARHPMLPAATVDFRYTSAAVITDVRNAAARVSEFSGQSIRWRQANPHGAPCHPGRYDDVSRRTVDVRTSDWARGHAHPRRILLFAPPALGFFGEPERFERVHDLGVSNGRIENTIVDGTLTVTGADVTIDGCAIRTLVTTDEAQPGLEIRNSLIGTIEVTGAAQMEYCTVLAHAAFGRLNASDCIFAGTWSIDEANAKSCVRYSAIPGRIPALRRLTVPTNTTVRPSFQPFEFSDPGGTDGLLRLVRRPARFGERGCGVLDPATPRAVWQGAEDGGEMGAYHGQAHALRRQAMLDKLDDFLPVGMEAVLVPDSHLYDLPPVVRDKAAS